MRVTPEVAANAEERMLAVARRYGWHSLRSAEEYATAIRLQRRGLGEAINGIGGHDGSFRAVERRKP